MSISNQIMNGTFGSVWVNGEKWMDVDAFESKVTLNYEEVNMAEDLATHQKYIGWNGEGSLTVKKVYSRGSSLIGVAAKTGIIPEITIVGKLADPAAVGAERVSMSGVKFNEFTLLAFEQKTMGTEELPFTFSDYDLVDLITA